MKFKVEVNEIVWETNTYIVEAESEEAARKKMLEGYGEGIVELVETYPDANEIKDICSITPIPEGKQ